ncbi:uncharacterized protein LOC128962504 [Oppia nitens]|uniref:uncharacterized protein LOC128962504 n=1 Tax=Oppia nitens TaxID=1686743 RepID=UPI0023DC2D49|nr:uncharacterized protein LOC128962504 [Oppia nitens]
MTKSKTKDMEGANISNNNDTYRNRLDFVANYIITFTFNIAVKYLIIGIVAKILFSQRDYVFIFAFICIPHLIVKSISYFNPIENKSLSFLIKGVLNIIFIVAAIILYFIYRLLMTNDKFIEDVIFQTSLFLFVIISTILVIIYVLIIKSVQQNDSLANKQNKSNNEKSNPKKTCQRNG